MGTTEQGIRYLSGQDIIRINCKVISLAENSVDDSGHVLNPNSLEYIADIVKSELMGIEVYPSLPRKACAYAFRIITRHVFLDGNKRTGMSSAFIFLRMNGCKISESLNNDQIVEMAIRVADGKISENDLALWFESIVE